MGRRSRCHGEVLTKVPSQGGGRPCEEGKREVTRARFAGVEKKRRKAPAAAVEGTSGGKKEKRKKAPWRFGRGGGLDEAKERGDRSRPWNKKKET